MTSTHWDALVYARTYEVDFRTIVIPKGFTIIIPKDFESSHLEWAMAHIYGTMRYPEQLREGDPIWSLFKNKSYCVVGVTCMARDLVDKKQQEYTRDSFNRPLYVFAGYVARSPGDPQEILNLGRDLDAFREPYEYVIQRWNEKQINEPIRSQYHNLEFKQQQDFECQIILDNLNNNKDKIRLFPDSEESKQYLWQTAACSLESTSVCLGLQRDRDIIYSPFLNVTKPGFWEPYNDINRPQPEPKQTDQKVSRSDHSSLIDKGFSMIGKSLSRGISMIDKGFSMIDKDTSQSANHYDDELANEENQNLESTSFMMGIKINSEQRKLQNNVEQLSSSDAWSAFNSDSQKQWQPNDNTDSQIDNDDIPDDRTEVNQ
ncbi:hypothetical protein [Roseofilum casamattae]|uniref:Uncharacterized protein n=1 Tax=Roseofilum casamattae BLCC-M143 TaxID=3022442 RepID=A0ABT7BTM0_9CYAN|nr:hypothetical protein [Roseofilum casamattae]MDJ1182534.1 hypothetical protein [Roseofilum casamattae BLCC-M143]